MHGQQNIKINRLVLITEMESVYCAVRTGCSYIIEVNFGLQRFQRANEDTTHYVTTKRTPLPHPPSCRLVQTTFKLFSQCNNTAEANFFFKYQHKQT